MTLVLYPLLKTPKGLYPGEFECATVRLGEGGTDIECPDRELHERLTTLFSTPIVARRSVSRDPNVVAWRVEELEPHTHAFFLEIRYHLHRHNLHGKLVKG